MAARHKHLDLHRNQAPVHHRQVGPTKKRSHHLPREAIMANELVQLRMLRPVLGPMPLLRLPTPHHLDLLTASRTMPPPQRARSLLAGLAPPMPARQARPQGQTTSPSRFLLKTSSAHEHRTQAIQPSPPIAVPLNTPSTNVHLHPLSVADIARCDGPSLYSPSQAAAV
jgi:hypothetical protein